VDAFDLDLGRLLVEQVVQLALVVVADGLVRVEEAAGAVDAAVPAVHAVAGDEQGALVERLALVVERRAVEVRDGPEALAARAHAAGDGEAAHLGRLATAPLDGQRALAAGGGNVEREGLSGADVRLAEAAEEDPEEGVGVGRR